MRPEPVNDVHSQLNETTVREVVPVDSTEAVRAAVVRAGEAVSRRLRGPSAR